MPDSLNRSAVLAGAVACLVLAVPAAIVTAVLGDDDGGTDQSNWVLVAFLVIVVAYLLGGAVAGRRAPTVPFINGAAATFLAFAGVQVVGVVRRIIADETISIGALVFNALLAPSIGVVGAWFGARRAAPTLADGGGEPAG